MCATLYGAQTAGAKSAKGRQFSYVQQEDPHGQAIQPTT
jgi:hypothetical protein